MNNYYPYHRKSIRLKDYNYSEFGAYFIIICTRNRELYFDKYQELKRIVSQQWQKIPNRYHNIHIDEYVIMPNHIHGIIIVGATLAVASNNWAGARPAPTAGARPAPTAGARPAPTIGKIIGSFKSLCVYNWLEYIKENGIDEVGKFWQRNYYEHIVRNENELSRIREYITNNPIKWELDFENPRRKKEYKDYADYLEKEVYRTGDIPVRNRRCDMQT